VYLSEEAYKAGADALLVVTPYYNKATQKGLKEHFTMVAKAVDLPMILYNVPSRTGCNILPETAVDMAKSVDNIVAIKEASGNISQVVKLAALAEGALDIYSGNDDQVIPLLSLGGKGVISVLSNVAPRQTHDMVMEYINGNHEKALQIQLQMAELCSALFCEVNPIPVKKAVELMGLCGGTLRRPLTQMEPQNAERLKAALEANHIL
jgi:4-hydroxy-tetrahydrodipicolinate synthase